MRAAIVVRASAWAIFWVGMVGSAPCSAAAQPAMGTPIHAVVSSVVGSTLSVQTDDKHTLAILVTPQTRVDIITPRARADLRPGAFVGSGAMTTPDGTLHAQEVHIFAQPGMGEGHRQMGNDPNHTMTNATIGKVTTAANGTTLTMDYKGGQQQIVVASDTPIIGLQTGTLADLKPGAAVTVLTRTDPAGVQSATVIMIGRNGAKPPI